MTSSAPTLAQAPDTELPPLPFPVSVVTDLMTHLGRAMRAHQLYMHNNPTYLRAMEQLRVALRTVWQHTDTITFEVTETQLKWEQRTVLHEPDKANENLPWLLYKDGVRELRLLREVEVEEITDLIDLLCQVRRAPVDQEDLLTLLWEREFQYVQYRYVDLALEAAPIERLPEDARERLRDSAAETPPLQEQILPPGVVNPDAFDSTLHFLDESEIEYLRDQIRQEYASDLRRNVLSVLLDIYETHGDAVIRAEVLSLLDGMMVTLLVNGQYTGVTYLLREIRACRERLAALSDDERAALAQLSGKLSEEGSLTQMLLALDERPEPPRDEDLEELFLELQPSALGVVFAWLGRLHSPRVRTALERAATRLAAANTGHLVKLITAPERDVMLEAARRAGAMRTAAAVPALARLLNHAEPTVRQTAVVALGEIGSPGALQHLEAAIDDSDRDVRVATARVFALRPHRPALARFEAAIRGRRMEGADLTERMAFFEAYGALCGEAGVALLDGFLNGRTLFGKKADSELRACAARALGRINTEQSLKALRKAAEDKDVLVRSTVNKALRGGDR